MRVRLYTVFFLLFAAAASAVEPEERLDDPTLEARAREISKELRCLVCQNESIDESNAELAADLRRLVRERLLAGDTDDEVRAFVVDRYGTYVLLKPPVAPSTYILWAGPFLVFLAAGGGLLFMALRSHRRHASLKPLEEGFIDGEAAPLPASGDVKKETGDVGRKHDEG